MIWMDEAAINNTSFKQQAYSKKGEQKIIHNRKQIKSTSLVLAVSKDGVILSQFIQGGLN